MSCYNTPPEIEYGFYQKDPARPIDVMPEPAFVRKAIVREGARRTATTALLEDNLTRGARKALRHLRSYVLKPIEPQEKKPFPVKFAIKLITLKLTQLVRRQKKHAREASTAKHLLAKMSPGPSRLRSAMTQRQDDSLARLGQVTAEIKARALACQGRLAETTE